MLERNRGMLTCSILLMICGITVFAFAARTLIHQQKSHIENAESFTYSFNVDGTLEEAGNADESSSEYWWLSSGGRLIIEDGIGKTIRGALPKGDRWRIAYAESSATDTDNGRYPQNLFRLVTRRTWENVSVELRFRIRTDEDTRTNNRNESNGILLMSRFQDEDTLYYVGYRVDGHAVIKKKREGTYTTLAELPVYPGSYSGENLLPHDEWISLRSETRTTERGVEITLYINDSAGTWQQVVRAIDAKAPILSEGSVGIRTDFMDVEFDDFRATGI